jgi:hypothetical protein
VPQRGFGRLAALDAVLECFVDTVGADVGLLVTRSLKVLAARERTSHRLPVSSEREDLLSRAIDADGALIEPGSPAERRRFAPTSSAVAAPVREPENPLGAIYAGFATPSSREPEDLRWIADSYARAAALCMTGDRGLTAIFCSGSELEHTRAKAADAGLEIARLLLPEARPATRR